MSRLQMKNSSSLAIKRTDDNRRQNYREKRARCCCCRWPWSDFEKCLWNTKYRSSLPKSSCLLPPTAPLTHPCIFFFCLQLCVALMHFNFIMVAVHSLNGKIHRKHRYIIFSSQALTWLFLWNLQMSPWERWGQGNRQLVGRSPPVSLNSAL